MTLYGEANGGGSNGDLFAFNLETDTFSILGSFDRTDGAGTFGGLTLMGSTLYGVTEAGGTNNIGTIFSIAIPEPATVSILAAVGGCLLLRRRKK
jgi:uncharacterized repeat protein (TIGR03803 family)